MNKRLLKGFFVGLVGLLIMITLISLLIPSKVIVTRSVVVHAPIIKISSFIEDIDQWKKWHPVFMQNSLPMQQKIINNKKVVTWKQNEKEHILKVTLIANGQFKFSIENGNRKLSDNIISVFPLQDGTGQQVEWASVNYLQWYPWQKFGGMFLNQISGPGYELALTNLRNLAESRPTPAN